MSGKVEGLVAKWRQDVATQYGYGPIGHALLACARDLEAAIGADAQSVAAGGEVGVTEASIFSAADALCGEWNLHYPDAVRMAKRALTTALATQHGDNT